MARRVAATEYEIGNRSTIIPNEARLLIRSNRDLVDDDDEDDGGHIRTSGSSCCKL